MFYKDIKADAKLVIGECDNDTLRRRVKEAIDVLANSGSGLWDGMTGEMTICVDSVCGMVTLPREVLKPISINTDGSPAIPRDKWFEYHLNGPGERYQKTGFMWDEKGEYPVCREPSEPTRLRIQGDNASDEGAAITVVYMDEDDRERSHTFALDVLDPETSDFFVKRIVAVSKPETVGDIRIYYVDPELTVAGWYAPDETHPMYRRVRVKAKNSIKMIYRRRTADIIHDGSYIPLRSKMAIIQALWSIKRRYQGDIAGANEAQADAYRLLREDQYVRMMTNSPIGPQVMDYSTEINESLWGGRGRRRYR